VAFTVVNATFCMRSEMKFQEALRTIYKLLGVKEKKVDCVLRDKTKSLLKNKRV
jgi:hypothetical protein